MSCAIHCWHETETGPFLKRRVCCQCGHIEESRFKFMSPPGHGPYYMVQQWSKWTGLEQVIEKLEEAQ